mmetsp:Transcript_21221/g.32879  ORF Transcript_21221/g.32879 Transcript_21221/m.32879 type:complete len:101 (+) Transcript_21221:2647-2949(+)
MTSEKTREKGQILPSAELYIPHKKGRLGGSDMNSLEPILEKRRSHCHSRQGAHPIPEKRGGTIKVGSIPHGPDMKEKPVIMLYKLDSSATTSQTNEMVSI